MNRETKRVLQRMANTLDKAKPGFHYRQYIRVLDGVAYCLSGPWLAGYCLDESLEDCVMDRRLKVVNGGVEFPDFRRAIPAALDEGAEVEMVMLAPLLASLGRKTNGVYLTVDWSAGGKGVPLLMAHATVGPAAFSPTRVRDAIKAIGDDILKTGKVYFDETRGVLIAASHDKRRFALIPAMPA